MQFEFDTAIRVGHWAVEPLVKLDVIIFTAVELNLLEAIVPSERVYLTLEVNSCEECFLLWHVLLDFDGHIIVVQVVVEVAVATN